MALNMRRMIGKGTQIPIGNLSRVPAPNPTAATPETGKKDNVVSVIVTICEGSSYDSLFRSIPQESEYGKVAVYLMNPGQVLSFVQRALQGENVAGIRTSSDGTLPPNMQEQIKQLVKDCEEAGPEAVCFNWECCSGFSSSGLATSKDYKDLYLDLIGYLVREFCCLAMFSDFSLKGLIADWDVTRLGPNPFVKVGEFGGDLTLSFDPAVLKKCPSAQLNTVGSLAEVTDGIGNARLHALGGTIAFTLTEEARQIAVETAQTVGTYTGPIAGRKYIEPYELEILTVATKLSNETFTTTQIGTVKAKKEWAVCEVGNKTGLAGHVIITYPPSQSSLERLQKYQEEEAIARAKALKDNAIAINVDVEIADEHQAARGSILASSGHWIELMKIDVNMNRLLETVKNEWGADNAVYETMNAAVTNEALSSEEQEKEVQMNSVSYIQSRAPAKFNKVAVRQKKKGF